MKLFQFVCLLFLPGSTLASAEEFCISPPNIIASTKEQHNLREIYHEIADILGWFPSLAATIEANSPQICVSSRTNNALGYLDVDNNRIVINRSLSKPLQVGILLHEIRHLWQLESGNCPSDDLAMKEYARATFALEADASAISLLIAWTMKESGEDFVWNALSSWPTQSDIASRFESTIEETGDADLAVTSAFYQWYSSPDRKDRYYRAACSDYLDRQDAEHFIPRYNLLDPNFFDNLCRLPDGTSYRCSDPDMVPNGGLRTPLQ